VGSWIKILNYLQQQDFFFAGAFFFATGFFATAFFFATIG
jgi:hypothetical protein